MSPQKEKSAPGWNRVSAEEVISTGRDTAFYHKNQAPFAILGYNNGLFYFLPDRSHEILFFTPDDITKENLLKIAPMKWWKHHYKNRKTADVANDLFRAAEMRGVFNHVRFFQNMLHFQRKMGWFI